MANSTPTNAVAQDLAQDGFRKARTAVVVDEAAMLVTRVTGKLLAAARQTGANVILAVNDRRLASIERGGLFAKLRQRHWSAEITEVTRQRVDW